MRLAFESPLLAQVERVFLLAPVRWPVGVSPVSVAFGAANDCENPLLVTEDAQTGRHELPGLPSVFLEVARSTPSWQSSVSQVFDCVPASSQVRS